MPINIYDKLVKAFSGTVGLADAVDIETSGSSNVQADLDGLDTTAGNLGTSIWNWKFNASVLSNAFPGDTFLGFNNAAKASATNVAISALSNSESARLDEVLAMLDFGDVMFIQERVAPANAVLYDIVGPAQAVGLRFDIPVAAAQTQGAEFTADAELNVRFATRGASNALRFVRDSTNAIETVDASNAGTFASSVSGITLRAGHAFRVATAGEPFAGSVVRAEIGDVIAAVVDSPVTTDVADWAILRKPNSLPVGNVADLFLRELTQTGNVFGFSPNVQIDRDNIEANYRQVIEAHGTAPDITSLQSKVDALYPLTPDVDILTDWADIYNPARASEQVNIVPGYSSIVDFRSTGDRFEQAGVTYVAGSGVSNYSGLGNDLHRVFGLAVDAPADKTLLSITDGGTQIPYIDMTVTGNFRVNNFTPARTQDQAVTDATNFASRSAGTGTIAVGGGASTYTVPDYPANTSSQTRTVTVDFDVLVDGSNSLAGGFVSFDIPDTDIASTTDQSHTFQLGWPHNRIVTAQFRFATRVSGPDLLLDITLLTAPTDITMLIDSVNVLQSYTATVVIPRVDNFITMQDDGVDFVFGGAHELIVAFHPFTDLNLVEVVPVVVNSSTGATTQLNDVDTSIPSPLFDAVQVPDDIEFRTFLPDHFLRHIDLVNLTRDRATKWCYALARLETVTEHAVSVALDLAAGTKVGGVDIPRSEKSLVLQATDDTTDLRASVTLPANYTNFDYCHVTEVAGGERRSVPLSVPVLSSADLSSTDLLRSQGNTDFTFNNSTRVLAAEPTQNTIYRVELYKF